MINVILKHFPSAEKIPLWLIAIMQMLITNPPDKVLCFYAFSNPQEQDSVPIGGSFAMLFPIKHRLWRRLR